MLAAQLKEAAKVKEAKSREALAARNRATAASAELTNEVWQEVNRGGLEVYDSEKLVEKELKVVEHQVRRFQQVNRQWMSLIGDIAEELKKLGDVTNWLEHTEQQMIEIEERLDELQTKTGGQERA